ncbi:MAG: DUF2380 domain-containing protein [Proteobacteria bacterium]|nr:DUF2380 domain-containing protein [Pseudomonadota bacterium]
MLSNLITKSFLMKMLSRLLIVLHILQINALTASEFFKSNEAGNYFVLSSPSFFETPDFFDKGQKKRFEIQKEHMDDLFKEIAASKAKDISLSVLPFSDITCSTEFIRQVRKHNIAFEICQNASLTVLMDRSEILFPKYFKHLGQLNVQGHNQKDSIVQFQHVTTENSLLGKILVEGVSAVRFLWTKDDKKEDRKETYVYLKELILRNVQKLDLSCRAFIEKIVNDNRDVDLFRLLFNNKRLELGSIQIDSNKVSFERTIDPFGIDISNTNFNLATRTLELDIECIKCNAFNLKFLPLQKISLQAKKPCVMQARQYFIFDGGGSNFQTPGNITFEFGLLKMLNFYDLVLYGEKFKGKVLCAAAQNRLFAKGLAQNTMAFEYAYFQALDVFVESVIYSDFLKIIGNTIKFESSSKVVSKAQLLEAREKTIFRNCTLEGDIAITAASLDAEQLTHKGHIKLLGELHTLKDVHFLGSSDIGATKTVVQGESALGACFAQNGGLIHDHLSHTTFTTLCVQGKEFVQRHDSKVTVAATECVIQPKVYAQVHHLESSRYVNNPFFDRAVVSSETVSFEAFLKSYGIHIQGQNVTLTNAEIDAKDTKLLAERDLRVHQSEIESQKLTSAAGESYCVLSSTIQADQALEVARSIKKMDVKEKGVFEEQAESIVREGGSSEGKKFVHAKTVEEREHLYQEAEVDVVAHDYKGVGVSLHNASQRVHAQTITENGTSIVRDKGGSQSDQQLHGSTIESMGTSVSGSAEVPVVIIHKADESASVEQADLAKTHLIQDAPKLEVKGSKVQSSVIVQTGDKASMEGNRFLDAHTQQKVTHAAFRGNVTDRSVHQIDGATTELSGNSGDRSTIIIKTKEIAADKNKFTNSTLEMEVDHGFVNNLFGSYEAFKIRANKLKLSGMPQIKEGRITSLSEKGLPSLDISDLFIVDQHISSKDKPLEEKTVRPTFVVMCDGEQSNLRGLQTKGGGSVSIDAKGLRKESRPNASMIEAFNLYLDIAPKTQEDVLELANSLSKVTNLNITAKDVVLLLESGRIYMRENLDLHLKAMKATNAYVDGKGSLSIRTDGDVELIESEFRTSGRLTVFAGGNLLRTASKTYSEEGTVLGAQGDVKGLAKVLRTSRGGETRETATVCEDESKKDLTYVAGGVYEEQGAKHKAKETTFMLQGVGAFDVAYESVKHERGSNWTQELTPICPEFYGDVKVMVNGGDVVLVSPIIHNNMTFVRDGEAEPSNVTFKLAQIHKATFETWTSSSWLGLRKTTHQRFTEDIFHQYAKVFGKIILDGPLKANAEKVQGKEQSLEFWKTTATTIGSEILESESNLESVPSYIKLSQEEIDQLIINELHKHDYHKQTRWSGLAFALVGITAAVLTAGTGLAAFAGNAFASSTFATSMGISSAFVTGFGVGATMALASTASVALLQADGNPLKAVKSLLNAKTFGQIILSGCTMGSCYWLGATNGLLSATNGFAVPSLATTQGVQYAALAACVNTAVSAAQGAAGSKLLLSAAVSIGAQTLGMQCLDVPNAEYIQTLIASLSGGISASIQGEDFGLGAGSGAAGSLMNMMLKDVEFGMSEKWDDISKQLGSVFAMGFAGLDPQHVNSGWQQQQTQILHEREKRQEEARKAAQKTEKERLEKARQETIAEKKRLQKEQNARRARQAAQEKASRKSLTKEEQDISDKLLNPVANNFDEQDSLIGNVFGQEVEEALPILREAALTPRTKAKLLVEKVYDQHRSHFGSDLNREDVGRSAYENAQNDVIWTAQLKDAFGTALTAYEQRVLDETRSFQTSREWQGLKDLDPLSYAKTARFLAGFIPGKTAIGLEAIAGAVQTDIDYSRGNISLKDYMTEMGMISVGAAISYKPDSFKGMSSALKHEAKALKQTTLNMGDRAVDHLHHMMEGSHSKPAFAYVNGRGRSFEQSSSFNRRAFSSGNVGRQNTFKSEAPSVRTEAPAPQSHPSPHSAADVPASAVPVETRGLLQHPKMVEHHLFNKFRGQSSNSQKYRDFFKKHDINVDEFCVKITETTHQRVIHVAGNNWTTRWKNWIDSNMNATTKEVYQFAGSLMDEYGISHLNILKYSK